MLKNLKRPLRLVRRFFSRKLQGVLFPKKKSKKVAQRRESLCQNQKKNAQPGIGTGTLLLFSHALIHYAKAKFIHRGEAVLRNTWRRRIMARRMPKKSYIFNRMRIYSTVQLCSITSLWHSGQHVCRAIGRLQVRISLWFWLFSKRRSLWSWLLWKKNLLSWTAMHIDFVMCKKRTFHGDWKKLATVKVVHFTKSAD